METFLTSTVINRGSLPGQACMKATQSLLRLTEAFPAGLPALCPVRQLRVTDMGFVQLRDERERLESTMDCYTCVRCPDFEAHVSQVFCVYFVVSPLLPLPSIFLTTINLRTVSIRGGVGAIHDDHVHNA